MVIFDIISDKIEAMKKLQKMKEIKSNRQQQEAIDKNYAELAEKIHNFMTRLKYAHTELNFPISDNIYVQGTNLLNLLKEAAGNGLAESDKIKQADQEYRTLNDTVKKEWTKHYAGLTRSTLSTLKAITKIDSQRITACREAIEAASTWGTSTLPLIALNKALAEAEEIICSLNLDPEIIQFLDKMNTEKATLADLTEPVLSWIKQEGFYGKVRLSFAVR